MRNINNRYSIKREIKNEDFCISYSAKDEKYNRKVIVCILKNNTKYNEYLNYLLKNYRSIKNLNFNNVINLIDTTPIFNIDGSKNEQVKYGYIIEDYDYRFNSKLYFNSCSVDDKIQIFMKLCSVVNTLNINGYIFNELTINNIKYIENKKGNINLKLGNILEEEFKKIPLYETAAKVELYPYNIKKDGFYYVNTDNIEELSKIFNTMFAGNNINSGTDELLEINKFFSYMHTSNKICTITNFIKHINNVLNKKYEIYVENSLCKLKKDWDIVGREEEIQIVERNLNNILSNKKNFSVICFSGDNGTGKTILLKEINHIITSKYWKKILCLTYIKDKIHKDTLKEQLFMQFDNLILEKYKEYITQFIDFIVNNEVTDDLEIYKIINRVSQCIGDYSRQNPIVILIDNLAEQPYILKLFIKYMCAENKRFENIMIIFTTNQSNWDEASFEYFQDLKRVSSYEHYTLNYFNQYNTKEIVSSMLNYSKEVNSLSLEIYEKTFGNPEYIISLIKELNNKEVLFFNEDNMKWEIRESVKKFPVPKEIDIKVNNIIRNLDKEHLKVLNELSVFSISLSEDFIFKYILTKDEVRKIYFELKEKRFITDKISDRGFLIGFTNDLLKNILYSRITDNEKKKMHLKASRFLEQELDSSEVYFKELFRHLLKIDDKEKLFIHLKDYAAKEEKSRNIKEAIKYYKSALKYAPINNKADIALNIAKLYENTSAHTESLEYFLLVKEYSKGSADMRMDIYASLEIILIMINQQGKCGQEIEVQLESIRKKLDIMDYRKGELYYYYTLIILKRSQKKYDDVIYYGNIVLKLYDRKRKNEEVFGWIFSTLATVNLRIGEFIKGKKYLEEAMEIFKINNHINGYLFCKDECAELEMNERGNYSEIISEFSEIVKISSRENLYKRQVTALVNIANCYYCMKNYIMAEKCFEKALESLKKNKTDYPMSLVYSGLCMVSLAAEHNEKAIRYYRLAYNSEVENVANKQGDEFLKMNLTEYHYQFYFCNYDKAYENVKIIYELLKNNNYERSNYFRCQYYFNLTLRSNDLDEITKCYELFECSRNNLCREESWIRIWYEELIIIAEKGFVEFAQKEFVQRKKRPVNYKTEAYYIYLECLLSQKGNYGYLVNKALRVCSLDVDRKIKVKLFKIIADKYLEMGCYDLALNYYYEAISIHRETYIKLAKEEAVIYINNSGCLEAYRKFVLCINNNMKIKINFRNFHKTISVDEYESLNEQINLFRIISNDILYANMQKLYEKLYYNDLKDIYTVFSRFDDRVINNLENVIKYLARVTLSDKAILLSTDSEGNRRVICNYRVSNVERMQKIVNILPESRDKITIIDKDSPQSSKEEFIENKIRACVCMKLINSDLYLNIGNKVNAMLIMATGNSIYNINEKSKKIMRYFEPFIVFLLEKYNLTIDSMQDKLTGCYNRKYFEENLLMAIESAKTTKEKFGVIMFDIDNFKSVNDKFGHQTGDEVLIKLVKEVSRSVSKNDIVGRYGGEEFLVLLPNINKEKLLLLAEKVRKNVEEAKILGDKRKVTISIGAYFSEDKISNCEEVIGKVDQALYKSKNTGKNKVTLWDNKCSINNENNDVGQMLFGNNSRDYKVGLLVADIVNIIKENALRESKISILMKEIMHTINCDIGAAFIIKDKSIVEKYIMNNEGQPIKSDKVISDKYVLKAINSDKNMHLIDWDNIIYDENKIPDWNSLCITPIKYNGQVIAVLYLARRISEKEFTNNDEILLSSLGQLSIPIFYNN